MLQRESEKEAGEDKRMEEEEGRDNKATPGETEEACITFSIKATGVNIILSIIGSVAYGLSMKSIVGWEKIWRGIPLYMLYYFYKPDYNLPYILIPIFGLLFTLLSLPLISRNPRYLSVAKFILVNLTFITIAYVVFLYCAVKTFWKAEKMQTFFLGIPIISLLLTFLLIFLNCWCNLSLPNCCYNFFNLPRVEHGVLVPSDPDTPYVLVNGKPVLDLVEEDVVSQSRDSFKLPKIEHGAIAPSDPLSHYVLDKEVKPALYPESEEISVKRTGELANNGYDEEPEGMTDKTATKL